MSNVVKRCSLAVLIAGAALWTGAARPASAICVGDCDEDGTVAINEVVNSVNIFLENSPVGSCLNADQNGDSVVPINEVVGAVNSFLDAATCPTVEGAQPTPTPTEPSEPPLGERVFSIFYLKTNIQTSRFWSSGLGGGNVAEGFLPGPLKLFAGPVNPATGIAPLSLKEDAIYGMSIVQGAPPTCFKLLAQGSSGSIDCDGGSAFDVQVTQDSNGAGPGDPLVWTTNLGTDGGAGAAMLVVTQAAKLMPAGATLDECATTNYTVFEQAVYTTEKATAKVLDALEGSVLRSPADGSITLIKTGKNFSCANWTTENGDGVLMLPVVTLDQETQPNTIWDISSVIQLTDK